LSVCCTLPTTQRASNSNRAEYQLWALSRGPELKAGCRLRVIFCGLTETFFPSSSLQAGWWRPIHLLHGETRSGGCEPFQVKHKVRETPRNSQRESKHAESRLPPLSPADRHRYCARVRERATSFFFDVLTPCRALDSSSASLHASAPTGLFSSFIVSPRTPPLTTAHRSTVAAGTPPLTIA
jgi:hypothetical protein